MESAFTLRVIVAPVHALDGRIVHCSDTDQMRRVLVMDARLINVRVIDRCP